MSTLESIFLVLLVISYLLETTNGAGVTTHMTFLARVIPNDFQRYIPWLKSGAFFPDSLYSCKPSEELSQFAEATHWPPFLIDSIKYWHEKYNYNEKLRYSEDSMHLQAFLLGVFTHQVVDSSWHSLVDGYRTHGLLRVLSETEFNGNIDDAHQFIDVMGEFIGLGNIMRDSQSTEWMYYTKPDWKMPLEEDMMAILHRNGLSKHEITFPELDLCVKRGLSASVTEIYTFEKRRTQILNVAYGISPAARDFMQECWLGGEFDLLATLKSCLAVVQQLFDTDKAAQIMLEEIKVCRNLPAGTREYLSNGLIKVEGKDTPAVISPVGSLSAFGTSLEIGYFKDDRVLYIAVGAPMEESNGNIYFIPIETLMKPREYSAVLEPYTRMRGQNINKFTYNNTDYLVVSEPGSNSVLFYYNEEPLLIVKDNSHESAFQLRVSSIRDIDGDGVPDLLLSGGNYGVNETGQATILYGKSLVKYLTGASPRSTISLSLLESVTLDGGPLSLPYQHFGTAVESSCKWNKEGFLYVTCQNLGVVFVYTLSQLQRSALPKYFIMENNILLANEASPGELHKVSSKVHGMFGRFLYAFENRDQNYVAISQHLFNRVYLFKEDGKFLEHYVTLMLIHVVGEVPASIGFGTFIKYDPSRELVYISSPGSHNGRGAIWKISMQDIHQNKKSKVSDTIVMDSLKNLHIVNPLKKEKGVSNFGKSLGIHKGKLVIGVPQYHYGNLEGHQLTGGIVLM